MNKIKEGDYVRVSHMYGETKIARITKILDKDSCYYNMQMYRIDEVVQHCNGCYPSTEIYKSDILKSSSNITDLIRKGDLLLLESSGKKWRTVVDGNDHLRYLKDILKSNDVKLLGITTKELIESEEYELGR